MAQEAQVTPSELLWLRAAVGDLAPVEAHPEGITVGGAVVRVRADSTGRWLEARDVHWLPRDVRDALRISTGYERRWGLQ